MNRRSCSAARPRCNLAVLLKDWSCRSCPQSWALRVAIVLRLSLRRGCLPAGVEKEGWILWRPRTAIVPLQTFPIHVPASTWAGYSSCLLDVVVQLIAICAIAFFAVVAVVFPWRIGRRRLRGLLIGRAWGRLPIWVYRSLFASVRVDVPLGSVVVQSAVVCARLVVRRNVSAVFLDVSANGISRKCCGARHQKADSDYCFHFYSLNRHPSVPLRLAL